MGIPFLDVPDTDLVSAVGGSAEEGFNSLKSSLMARFGADMADLGAEALSGALRGSRQLPNTRVRLSHAYTLRTAKGRVIGAVYRTSVNQSREIDTEWEIDPGAHGEPADIIPQTLNERSFQIARWDLYEDIMEEVFGTRELEMLTDQSRGFKIREAWRAPVSFLNSAARQYEYLPCFFRRLGRVQETQGDRTIRVDGELDWLRRRRVF